MIGPGAPLSWPGAFSQLPLPLHAFAEGGMSRSKAAIAAADEMPVNTLITTLHCIPPARNDRTPLPDHGQSDFLCDYVGYQTLVPSRSSARMPLRACAPQLRDKP